MTREVNATARRNAAWAWADPTLPTLMLAFLLVLLPGSCASGKGRTLIFAASSLAAATEGIDTALESAGLDPPEWMLAGSSRLIAQVRDGARPDIVVAADASQLRAILDFGYVLVDRPRIANRLVLAVANGNPANVTSINDLGREALVIGVCAPEVPCGATALRVADKYGIGLRPDTAEPNVRALAHKLARGELDVGLIYATDARSLGLATVGDPRLKTAGDCSHVAVSSYGIAVLTSESDAVSSSAAASVSVDRYLPSGPLTQAGFELGSC